MPVTPETVADEAPRLLTVEVELLGRMVEVQMISAEQTAIVRRLQAKMTDPEVQANLDAAKAIRLIDRALRAVMSIIVKDEDKEFVEDQVMDRKTDIVRLLPWLKVALAELQRVNTERIDAINADSNRESRRKAAKKGGKSATLITG